MRADFTDTVDKLLETFDQIIDLLPLRAVSRRCWTSPGNELLTEFDTVVIHNSRILSSEPEEE
jgi:hypothetical protein